MRSKSPIFSITTTFLPFIRKQTLKKVNMFLNLRSFVTFEVKITNIFYHYNNFIIYKKTKPQKSKTFPNLRIFFLYDEYIYGTARPQLKAKSQYRPRNESVQQGGTERLVIRAQIEAQQSLGPWNIY